MGLATLLNRRLQNNVLRVIWGYNPKRKWLDLAMLWKAVVAAVRQQGHYSWSMNDFSL